jgi:hypothetical protein
VTRVIQVSQLCQLSRKVDFVLRPFFGIRRETVSGDLRGVAVGGEDGEAAERGNRGGRG